MTENGLSGPMVGGLEYEMSMEEMEYEAMNAAATSIQRWWCWHHNRAIFRRMKLALDQASGAIATEVLKQLCPTEAVLLSDPTLDARVRFRLGGVSFPPDVLFKVFLTHEGSKIIYLSGKKMIKPASEAAEDSLEQMGKRKFIDIMLEDSYMQQKSGVMDELDVTSMKEYMQYSSSLDKQPAWMGGRDNGWRTLLPTDQHGVLYDFMEFAHGEEASTRLLECVPRLRSPESLDEVQQKLRLVQERALKASLKLSTRDVKGERMPRQARRKHMEKMRELYGLKSTLGNHANASTSDTSLTRQTSEEAAFDDIPQGQLSQEFSDDLSDSEVDAIEHSLYTWSQGLQEDIFDGL